MNLISWNCPRVPKLSRVWEPSDSLRPPSDGGGEEAQLGFSC